MEANDGESFRILKRNALKDPSRWSVEKLIETGAYSEFLMSATIYFQFHIIGDHWLHASNTIKLLFRIRHLHLYFPYNVFVVLGTSLA
jgi:hypothetical protein